MAHIFLLIQFSDPERYGNVKFSDDGCAEIIEKPKIPSKYAITGLYFYDETVVEKSKELKYLIEGN